jgi:hypothetical protein
MLLHHVCKGVSLLVSCQSLCHVVAGFLFPTLGSIIKIFFSPAIIKVFVQYTQNCSAGGAIRRRPMAVV